MQADVVADIIKHIDTLEREIAELKQKPLYEILNVMRTEIISADQNNYNLGDYDIIFLDPDGNHTIHGITGGFEGRRLLIYNTSLNTLTLQNQSGSADAENRITTLDGTSITFSLNSVLLMYVNDPKFAGSTRWKVLIVGA